MLIKIVLNAHDVILKMGISLGLLTQERYNYTSPQKIAKVRVSKFNFNLLCI